MMIMERCFRELDNTNTVGQYVTIVNFIFEMFVIVYKDRMGLGTDDPISFYKAFKGLKPETLYSGFESELSTIRAIRNDLTHDLENIHRNILDALELQDEFEVYIKKFETLLSGYNFNPILDAILTPISRVVINKENTGLGFEGTILDWRKP